MKKFVLATIALLSACSNDELAGTGSSADLFEEFADPQQYADLVERAEQGGQRELNLLTAYYGASRNPEMRNLEYWSKKSFEFQGLDAYRWLIWNLVEVGECDRAWAIVDDSYEDREFLGGYSAEGGVEKLISNCPRLIVEH